MTAGEQFGTGFSSFITEIRERRFPVVDEERGLVYAIIFFDHAGTVPTVKLTDGTTMTVPLPYDTPYTYLIGELQDQERQDPSHRSGAPARPLRHALRLGSERVNSRPAVIHQEYETDEQHVDESHF
jgi:hypothetical protein